MERNSRLCPYETLVAEGGFFEPDAELMGHLTRHRRELSSWMRAGSLRQYCLSSFGGGYVSSLRNETHDTWAGISARTASVKPRLEVAGGR